MAIYRGINQSEETQKEDSIGDWQLDGLNFICHKNTTALLASALATVRLTSSLYWAPTHSFASQMHWQPGICDSTVQTETDF